MELHQSEAAALLSEAELEYRWIDVAFATSGNEEFHIFDLDIVVPPIVYRGIADKHKDAVERIESAIYEISRHKDRYAHIKAIEWFMRLPKLDDVASTPEISDLFTDSTLFEVQRLWTKAKSRVIKEPDGAITAARTMLESVCRAIISDSDEVFTNKDDLSTLFRKAIATLDLAPGSQSVDDYRKLASACVTISNAISSLRNRESDAHAGAQPAVHNAKFVVNVAGSLVEFLVGLRNEKESGEVNR